MKALFTAAVVSVITGSIFFAATAQAAPDTTLPLGTTITATCLVVTKAENDAKQNYQWVQATRLPNLAACQAFENSLKTRALAFGGDTKLVQTRVDADCGCTQAIDRLRTKFYDPAIVE